MRPSSRAWMSSTVRILRKKLPVVCGEAASRGFWVTTYAPYGYRKVYVQDGVKKRPKLELKPAR